jgi:TRAP-type mannitol/chloroaromatic compound transport system permease small subunit
VTGLLAISRAIDRLNAGFAYLAEYLVFIAVLVSAGNAVSRYAFNFTSNGALEAQWYMFAAIVMLGAAYTLRMNEHVRVDIIYAGLPDRVRLAVDAVGIILFLMPFTLYLVWLSWPFFWESFRFSEMSGNPGGLIRWPAKLVLPLGFFLLFLQGISELIKRIAALAGAIDLDSHYEKPVQ